MCPRLPDVPAPVTYNSGKTLLSNHCHCQVQEVRSRLQDPTTSLPRTVRAHSMNPTHVHTFIRTPVRMFAVSWNRGPECPGRDARGPGADGRVSWPRPCQRTSRKGRRIAALYLERWRIFLRLRWRRRVRFFFHFQRILEWAFFQGLDLWPPPRRRSTRCRVDSARVKACRPSVHAPRWGAIRGPSGGMVGGRGANSSSLSIKARAVAHPSGCCSRRGCGRPRAACRRRSGAAGRAGSPPCLGSFASRSRWYRLALRQG